MGKAPHRRRGRAIMPVAAMPAGGNDPSQSQMEALVKEAEAAALLDTEFAVGLYAIYIERTLQMMRATTDPTEKGMLKRMAQEGLLRAEELKKAHEHPQPQPQIEPLNDTCPLRPKRETKPPARQHAELGTINYVNLEGEHGSIEKALEVARKE